MNKIAFFTCFATLVKNLNITTKGDCMSKYHKLSIFIATIFVTQIMFSEHEKQTLVSDVIHPVAKPPKPLTDWQTLCRDILSKDPLSKKPYSVTIRPGSTPSTFEIEDAEGTIHSSGTYLEHGPIMPLIIGSFSQLSLLHKQQLRAIVSGQRSAHNPTFYYDGTCSKVTFASGQTDQQNF